MGVIGVKTELERKKHWIEIEGRKNFRMLFWTQKKLDYTVEQKNRKNIWIWKIFWWRGDNQQVPKPLAMKQAAKKTQKKAVKKPAVKKPISNNIQKKAINAQSAHNQRTSTHNSQWHALMCINHLQKSTGNQRILTHINAALILYWVYLKSCPLFEVL